MIKLFNLKEGQGSYKLRILPTKNIASDPEVIKIKQLLNLPKSSGNYFTGERIEVHFISKGLVARCKNINGQSNLCQICDLVSKTKSLELKSYRFFLFYIVDPNNELSVLKVDKALADAIIFASISYAKEKNKAPFSLLGKEFFVFDVDQTAHPSRRVNLNKIEEIPDWKLSAKLIEEFQAAPLLSDIYPLEWPDKIKEIVAKL